MKDTCPWYRKVERYGIVLGFRMGNGYGIPVGCGDGGGSRLPDRYCSILGYRMEKDGKISVRYCIVWRGRMFASMV